MAFERKYGAAAEVPFPLIDRGTNNFENSPVGFDAGDTSISKDGGGFVNTTNNPTHTGFGIYRLTLTATEMQAAEVVIVLIDQSGPKLWEDQSIVVETFGNASANKVFDFDLATQPVNLVQIDGLTTNATNATLNLKQLNIDNNSGSAIVAASTGSNGHGFECSGNGTGRGFDTSGGATGDGFRASGGATSGPGARFMAVANGHGLVLTAAGSGNNGMALAAGTNGSGISATGDGSGHGILALGGTTGDGLRARAGPTSGAGFHGDTQGGDGHGMQLTGNGTGDGLLAEVGGSGLDINATTSDNFQVNVTQISGSTTAANNAEALHRTVVTGTVTADGGNTAATFKISLTDTDDYFGESTNGGAVLCFIDGANNQHQCRRVSDYVNATTFVTVESDFDAIPTASDVFILVGRIEAP